MSSLLSKALVYLGLVDEDQAAYDVEPQESRPRPARPEPVYEERRQPPPPQRRIEGVSSVEGR
ncbi:MAG TPA: hypothetical protein VK088_10525, partial [Acidimicrobiia bacterium]|nr:hypothetical protein [Acidimicrobiia bacterium]